MANKAEPHAPPDDELTKPAARRPRRRAAAPAGRRSQRGKRRGPVEKRRGAGEKRRGQKDKRRGQGDKKEGVTVKRTWSDGKRRWDKKHYCVFCRRPQVKIARHLLRKHADQQEVAAVSTLPTGSKQRHLLLEHLRCRGNYLHNIEVIRQGSGEIVPWRQPSEEVDARNYLPCPLCLGFFLRADLWKHQASCRKKIASDPSRSLVAGKTPDPSRSLVAGETPDPAPLIDATSDSAHSADDGTSKSTENVESGEITELTGTKQPTDLHLDQNRTSDPGVERPRKRSRVQAAASRLLPISSGASESCSEVLHRMNQDQVSHQVKSDWLICKYGNKLMGTEDGSQRRYDYVSQKLRELGRFLLAAKSLDSGIQTLQDLLAPGRLSLVLAAARKASGYRWSRPPLALKTTLKTVCEIAIGESLQDGDWETAAKTTDCYHLLGREWDNLGLRSPDPDTAAVGGMKQKKKSVQSRSEKEPVQEPESEPRLEVPSQSSNQPLDSRLPIPPLDSRLPIPPLDSRLPIPPLDSRLPIPPLDSRLPIPPLDSRLPIPPLDSRLPIPAPVTHRKVRRRPWSSAEKEAVWRQLGVHVLLQSVPGKEVCQRCLDLEPVLRGRHWKDVKNQIHNQIQSQKKQQFHAQVDLQENQEQQDQIQNQKKQEQAQYQAHMDPQDQNKKKHLYHIQMEPQDQDSVHNQKKQQYQAHMDPQDHLQIYKKQLCHTRIDHQDHVQVPKKQLYRMDEQTNIDQDTSMLAGTHYGLDGPHRALDRDPTISPYPLPHRILGPHMDQLLSRTEWTDESLTQHYSVGRPLDRNLLQDAPPGGPPANPHSGHVHF